MLENLAKFAFFNGKESPGIMNKLKADLIPGDTNLLTTLLSFSAVRAEATDIISSVVASVDGAARAADGETAAVKERSTSLAGSRDQLRSGSVLRQDANDFRSNLHGRDRESKSQEAGSSGYGGFQLEPRPSGEAILPFHDRREVLAGG